MRASPASRGDAGTTGAGGEGEIREGGASLATLASSPGRFADALGLSRREVAEAVAARRAASAALHARLLALEREKEHALSAAEMGREKHRMICRHRFEHRRNPFVCRKCWTHAPICVCASFEGGGRASLPAGIAQVIVWTHHDEWGRVANTGSLLPLGLQNTALLMKGLDEHEEMMRRWLGREDVFPVVLWPGKGRDEGAKTTTFEEIRARIIERDETFDEGRGEAPARTRRLLLIAVEGTWNHARKMVNKLPPHVPRLDVGAALARQRLAEEPGGSADADAAPASLLAPLRRRGQGGGAADVSTLEAVAAALRALGLGEGEARRLLAAARAKVRRVGEYAGKPPRRMG